MYLPTVFFSPNCLFRLVFHLPIVKKMHNHKVLIYWKVKVSLLNPYNLPLALKKVINKHYLFKFKYSLFKFKLCGFTFKQKLISIQWTEFICKQSSFINKLTRFICNKNGLKFKHQWLKFKHLGFIFCNFLVDIGAFLQHTILH